MKIALAAAYLGSILAAAWAVTHVGTQYDPHGPHVLPVWPSIEAPSGVYLIGLTLVLRDLLQRRAGKAATFALMIVGARDVAAHVCKPCKRRPWCDAIVEPGAEGDAA